jgi:hypothetical protein
MKVVKVRSPFIIQVNEAGAIGSKVELYIYPNGSSVPATPTYTLSKLNPSTTQLNTSYNVSNYVKEYIDNIKPTYNDYPSLEQNNEWIKFQVKRYKLVGATYTLLDTIDYIGVNGFLNYTDGYQNPNATKLLLLSNTNIINYYWKDPANYLDRKIEYLNLLIEKDTNTTTTVTAKYERNDTGVYSSTQNILGGVSGIYNITIPISLVIVDGNFINGCKVTITLTPVTGSPIVYVFNTYPIEECKYTPVRCSFINRYGGWKDIIFFKAQTNAVSVKGSEYNLLPDAINYNIYKGQSKVFNINGTQTVKLNTGWVDENYNELITDLLLSETVLLDNKPVKVKTQSHTFKTQLKDKMINFEIDFEYAFDLINDVV